MMKVEDIFGEPLEIEYDKPFRFNTIQILGLEELIKDEKYTAILNQLIDAGTRLVREGKQLYRILLEKELIPLGIEIKNSEKTAFYLYKYRNYAKDLFDDCKKIALSFGTAYYYCFTCDDEDGYAEFILKFYHKDIEYTNKSYLEEALEKILPLEERLEKYKSTEHYFAFYILGGAYFEPNKNGHT